MRSFLCSSLAVLIARLVMLFSTVWLSVVCWLVDRDESIMRMMSEPWLPNGFVLRLRNEADLFMRLMVGLCCIVGFAIASMKRVMIVARIVMSSQSLKRQKRFLLAAWTRNCMAANCMICFLRRYSRCRITGMAASASVARNMLLWKVIF